MPRLARQPASGPRWALALSLLGVGAGCEPYRIEYHRRPSFYQEMSKDRLPDRITLEDGTEVVYQQYRGQRRDPIRERTESPGFQLRAEREDGSIALRALMPEHVLAHCLTCIRAGEYRLLWDELVAERTKLAYAEQGFGYEEFEAFMLENRVELARMLARMNLGINMHECGQGYIGPDLYRVQFHPRVVLNPDGTRQFKFSTVDMVQEGFQMKLVLIH